MAEVGSSEVARDTQPLKGYGAGPAVTKPLVKESIRSRVVTAVKNWFGLGEGANPLATHERRDQTPFGMKDNPEAYYNRVQKMKEEERKRQSKYGG